MPPKKSKNTFEKYCIEPNHVSRQNWPSYIFLSVILGLTRHISLNLSLWFYFIVCVRGCSWISLLTLGVITMLREGEGLNKLNPSAVCVENVKTPIVIWLKTNEGHIVVTLYLKAFGAQLWCHTREERGGGPELPYTLVIKRPLLLSGYYLFSSTCLYWATKGSGILIICCYSFNNHRHRIKHDE